MNYRHIRGTLRALLLASAAIATLAGAPAQAQTRGGTLRAIVHPEPPILITAINSQSPTQFVGGKIFQGLLTYDADLKPQPSLARAWRISPDGLVYTFELQPDVKWHDGKPFSADDVGFSIDKLVREVHPRTKLILNAYVESVRAVDPATVEIRLKEPFAPFISMFETGTMPMMPKHLYEGTDYRNNPANQHPVGTGPFKFKEWVRGSHIALVRNDEYWKPGLPYLDGIRFQVIPDSASRAVAFEQANVDLVYGDDVDSVDIKRLRALPGVQYTTKGWEMFGPMGLMVLNQREAPFDNVLVRRAVMHALNRDFIVKNIFFGMGRVPTGPFSSATLFHDKDLPVYDYNIKKARALIKESGVDVGQRTLRLLAFPYGANWERVGEYTRQTLEQLGFKVDIQATDAGGWASRMSQWDFDISFNHPYQYGDPVLGVQRLYLSSNRVKGTPFGNNQGYHNPKADALWQQAARSVDPAERQKLYSELQRILVDDAALGWLLEIDYPTLYRGNVHNLVTSAIGVKESFDTVYLDAR
ncbi:extracellular substrate-binding protein%2Cfamily 5 [Bordetella pertussis]|nr:extracellular substrate-binding protein%2Cfamily 5 [Bordetella pertussis]